jgi:hypothetical protein
MLIVHSFDEQNEPFAIVFDEVGINRERFNGHAVFRFRREELRETDRSFLLKCGPSLSISILRISTHLVAVQPMEKPMKKMVRPQNGIPSFQ